MNGYVWAFVAMGLNPFGGLFVAIPLGMFKLQLPAWLTCVLAVALAYVQVLVVELGFARLARWPAFVRFVEARRSPRLEGHLASPVGALWVTLLSPWVGPWLVMALSRFAGVGLGRVGVPLLLGLSYVAILTGLACVFAPELLPQAAGALISDP